MSEFRSENLIKERSRLNGTQRIYRFPNNYGASVVKHDFSYGHEKGLYELAIVRFPHDPPIDEYVLSYETPIANDVIGYLSVEEVNDLLEEISKLDASKIINYKDLVIDSCESIIRENYIDEFSKDEMKSAWLTAIEAIFGKDGDEDA